MIMDEQPVEVRGRIFRFANGDCFVKSKFQKRIVKFAKTGDYVENDLIDMICPRGRTQIKEMNPHIARHYGDDVDEAWGFLEMSSPQIRRVTG